ncbi:hypothetical protein [Roseovarius rhodophyticola]|uniref:Uncharacterized protein n=1 Tax=Roseovarius rhodophyticola TaxID=3080827 RepID=A0ABZ2TI90_9RHOB|nr:hypothetical protein [Roseovarius sp. W115]MDV2931220.1 hypothetical protein [Roseovarius sp. W115]
MTAAARPEFSRADINKARSVRAKRAASYVRAGLIIAVMAAAWQERAFWPFLHDRMQLTYDFGLNLYDNSADARGQIAALTGFDNQSSNSGSTAIVDTLKKLSE